MDTCMVAFLGCCLVPIHASEANHATGPTCSPRNRPHLLTAQPAPAVHHATGHTCSPRNRSHLLTIQPVPPGTCSPRNWSHLLTTQPAQPDSLLGPAYHPFLAFSEPLLFFHSCSFSRRVLAVSRHWAKWICLISRIRFWPSREMGQGGYASVYLSRVQAVSKKNGQSGFA